VLSEMGYAVRLKEKALFETMELLQEFASDDEGAEDAA